MYKRQLQQEVALCQSIATIWAFHDVTDEFYQTELQETLPRLEGSLDVYKRQA